MFNRLTVLFCALALLFLAACGGSKSSRASYDDDGYEGGGSGGGGSKRAAPAKTEDIKQANRDAVSLTEENHKLAKEIFDLKNKLGLPTDED